MTTHKCHVCGYNMVPHVVARTFHSQDRDTKVITSKTLDVTEFVCENCGECIYESNETKRIEHVLSDIAV